MHVGVLGASGSVGLHVVDTLLDRGHSVRAQSRKAARLARFESRAEIVAFEPGEAAVLGGFVAGLNAVIFALGIAQNGPTTFFSGVTRALIPEMERAGVRRLVVITGVGAGETRGHGGFLYDRMIFPLFTRHRYADKDRQEALIAASSLDWVIVRPAPFAATVPAGEMQVLTEVAPGTRLTKVTRAEVAAFVVAQVEGDRYLRMRPFIGHG
ncbi:MAG: NAD(P)H-binding protein [Pseudomonadota bacterium]